MKRARFRRMLVWAVAGPVALLAVLAVTFLFLIRWLNIEADRVEHTDQVISAAQRAQGRVIDMETAVRGYLLTHNDVFLRPYAASAADAERSFQQLHRVVADNPEQVDRAGRLERLFQHWQQFAAQMLTLRSDSVVRDAAQIAGKARMDAIRGGFSQFIAVEEGLRAKRSAAVRQVTRSVIVTSVLAALLFGAIVGYFTRKALQTVARDYEGALEQSESACREAESASRAKDEFLATLSHELRTPLTVILGWSRLMQMHDTDSENVKIALDAIERSARAQATLIEDILEVSRIITGKLRLEVLDVNLRDAIRQAVESVQPAAKARQIEIDVDSPGRVIVRADPNRLQQIIWNLLSNAVKFSPARTRISIRVSRSADDVVLTIADQGRGIDPAFLPYVFDRFRQADSTPTREYGGLGIGLSVVKLLTELHGGVVRAESAGVGKGSTFTITLPAHETRVPASEELGAAGDVAQPLADHDLLVVDDDDDACAVIGAMLRSFGGRVEVASSVPEAMEILARRKFAVIITDIAMPAEDGFQLLQRLRARGGLNGETPVIAVTALTGLAARDDRGEFAAILQKPVDPADLAATFASMMQ
ncbi:MAG: CHASE3 domain-containing protein [Thermoanaerobaculia bacterium]